MKKLFATLALLLSCSSTLVYATCYTNSESGYATCAANRNNRLCGSATAGYYACCNDPADACPSQSGQNQTKSPDDDLTCGGTSQRCCSNKQCDTKNPTGLECRLTAGGEYCLDSGQIKALTGGGTSNKIYIPHLKETTVLSTLLQAFFNPAEFFSKKVDPKKTETVIEPLFPRLNPIPPKVENLTPDGLCQINTVRANPGDSLLGPNLGVNLTYTQKYEYNLPPNYFDGCVKTGRAANPKRCCTGDANLETDKDGKSFWECTEAAKVKMDTKGRMITGVNAPLLDKLDENLVGGKQSAVKRIFPQELTAGDKLEDIPAQANYTAQSLPGTVKEAPKIYFPHLGAIYDYFLKGIQTALRPFINTIDVTPNLSGDCFTVAENTDVSRTCSELTDPPPSSKICLANRELQKIIYSAANYANVPAEIIAGILSIETRNKVFDIATSEVAKHISGTSFTPQWCAANSCGAMGAMQLLTSYGVTNACPNQKARQVNNWATYSCKKDADTNPNPGNLRDSIMAGAKMLRAIFDYKGYTSWNETSVRAVAGGYYGSCAPVTSDPSFINSLNKANSCLTPLKSRSGIISYCDYLWHYYNDRR